ncbi:MAG: DUF427 domain-containing protein [Pseudomonadota bacterium]
MTEHSNITMVEGGIHNPAEPRHFMRIKPVAGFITIRHGLDVVAESSRALRVLEVGRDIYDPVVYVPKNDVRGRIVKTEKTTHCPIKGDACYFNLIDAGDQLVAANIAWSYTDPVEGAEDITEFVAFYPNMTSIEEKPS